jgi:magnesium transporter
MQFTLQNQVSHLVHYIDLSNVHLFNQVFRIHPLTVEDILTEDSREKCELYPHYYFCCFQSFDQDVNSDTFLDPITIFSVVGHNFVLTFHRVPYVHASNVLRRIQRQSEANAYINVDTRLLSITPDWINYALIDDVTDGFLPFMAQLQLEVETIDELVLILRQSEQADMLRRMGKTRRLIITLARLLVSKPDVVRSLIKWRRIKHNDEIILYLSDIQGEH